MRTEEEEEEDFDYNDAVDVHVPDVQREDQELDFEFLGSASY